MSILPSSKTISSWKSKADHLEKNIHDTSKILTYLLDYPDLSDVSEEDLTIFKDCISMYLHDLAPNVSHSNNQTLDDLFKINNYIAKRLKYPTSNHHLPPLSSTHELLRSDLISHYLKNLRLHLKEARDLLKTIESEHQEVERKILEVISKAHNNLM